MSQMNLKQIKKELMKIKDFESFIEDAKRKTALKKSNALNFSGEHIIKLPPVVKAGDSTPQQDEDTFVDFFELD